MFCQLLLAIKVNIVDKMMQSNYLCIVVTTKKILIFTVLPDF